MLRITRERIGRGDTAGPPLRRRMGSFRLVFVPELHAQIENYGGMRHYELDRIQVRSRGEVEPSRIRADLPRLLEDLVKQKYPWQKGHRNGDFFFGCHVLLDISALPSEARTAFRETVLAERGDPRSGKRCWELIAFREDPANPDFVIAFADDSIRRWSNYVRVYGRELEPGCTLTRFGVPVTDAGGKPFAEPELQLRLTVDESEITYLKPDGYVEGGAENQ